jgi:hypothetical protein
LKRHLKISSNSIELIGKEFHNLLHVPAEEKEELFTHLEDSLSELKNILLRLDTNLKVKEILPISSDFRNTNLNPILLNSMIENRKEIKSKNNIEKSQFVEPLKVVIEVFQLDF